MVDAEDTWPRQLERISNVSTYSMAFGGFAPTHELLLWEEAKQLGPEVVIVAMYAGNDLFDCFRLAYFGENLTEFRSSDPAVLEAIDGLKSDQSHSNLADRGEQYSPARAWVRKNSSLYGLLRALRDVVSDRSWRDDPGWEKAKVTARYPGNAAFESDDARTVFTVARRTLALDLDDVRIREGHRIALAALERIDRLTSEAGAKLLVLFLPTKEYVFSDRVFAKGGAPIVGFSKLVENERSMWADTTRFLTERSISHVDALSTLRRSFSDGRQPFRTDLDGHLNPYGNRQIAELVHRELQARGLVDPPRPEPAIGR